MTERPEAVSSACAGSRSSEPYGRTQALSDWLMLREALGASRDEIRESLKRNNSPLLAEAEEFWAHQDVCPHHTLVHKEDQTDR